MAFELLSQLKKLKSTFTKLDYYLTMEEQLEKLWLSHSHMRSHNPHLVNYFKEMEILKEKFVKKALKIGDKFTHFTLDDENSNFIDTRNYLRSGPLVISFFRGSWCCYCVQEICVLESTLPRILSLGANLVSIGPDITSVKYFRNEGVVGTILIDTDLKVSKSFGLVYDVNDNLKNALLSQNVDLDKYNGNVGWKLPMPATYIVDENGTIVFSHVTFEHYKRCEPQQIVECLYNLFEEKEKNDNFESILGKRINEEMKIQNDKKDNKKVKKKL